MAKELPYFKFETLAFMSGDIYIERWELQGIFYNICAFYWSKDCEVSLTTLSKKYNGSESLIEELVNLDIIKLDGEFISINFLNEQWTSKETQKQINIINGKKGGRPKKQNETENKPNGFSFANRNDNQNHNRNESHIDIEYNKSKVEVNKEVEENFGFDFSEEKEEIFEAIKLKFGFQEQKFINHWRTINAFIEKLFADGLVEHFKEQFENYFKYKALAKEKEHNFTGFLGTPAMRFENSGWNAENWGDKIANFKAVPANKSKFEQKIDTYNELKKFNPHRK